MGTGLHNRIRIPHISPLVKHNISVERNFFAEPHIHAFFPAAAHILGKSAKKEAHPMDPESIRGDVDDLIYQEEWTVSER